MGRHRRKKGIAFIRKSSNASPRSGSSGAAIEPSLNASPDVEGQQSSPQDRTHEPATTPVDEAIEIGHDIGHDGHMVAEMYQESKDAKALIRMGIFTGIALAFHVSCIPPFRLRPVFPCINPRSHLFSISFVSRTSRKAWQHSLLFLKTLRLALVLQ